MAGKRYSDEELLDLLRQVELDLNTGSDVESACRKAGAVISRIVPSASATAVWRKSQFQEFRSLEKENARLKRSVTDL